VFIKKKTESENMRGMWESPHHDTTPLSYHPYITENMFFSDFAASVITVTYYSSATITYTPLISVALYPARSIMLYRS
jgi:hypothetical protein